MIAIATAVFAVLNISAVYAQDKYTLVSPGRNRVRRLQGLRGLVGGVVRPHDEVLKVIVANPTMIEAYKAGVPGNGKPFPEGAKIAKLQWKPKKSTEAPFVVDVPDVFAQAFLMEKDSKRFPKTGGWGYAVFNYDAKRPTSSRPTREPRRLRTRLPRGREDEGLHLPPVPECGEPGGH